jgi:AhpD family alkylhydroperoxidase
MDYHYPRKRDPQVFKYFDRKVLKAFGTWNELVFKDGKLDRKTKELIALGCAYTTQCPYCIDAHSRAAMKAGAVKEEVGEVIQIAAALSAGAPIAHRNMALDAIDDHDQ